MMMTDEEMKKLKRRFGDDPLTWPAPFRKLLQVPPDEDAIDRLVREVAVADIRSERLPKQILHRLHRQRRTGPFPVWPVLPSPRFVVAAGFALAIVAMTSGYQFARIDGGDTEVELFAIAAGVPTKLLLDADIGGQEIGL